MYTNITNHQVLHLNLSPIGQVPNSLDYYSRSLEVTDTKGDVMTITLFAKDPTQLEIQERADVK
jgi:hypothetical protein